MRIRNYRSEAGSASLIGVLIALSIIMLMLSIAIPNAIRVQQVTNENAAALQAAQAANVLFTYAQLYGGFPNLSDPALQGDFKNPASCSNALLAPSSLTLDPLGYRMTFTHGAALTNSSCAAIPMYQSFAINLDPSNRLQAQRHFYTDQSGVVRFNTTQAAGPGDPVFPITDPSKGVISTFLSSTATGTNNNGPTENQVFPIVFNPPTGSYSATQLQSITLSTATPNSTIYYTLDGSSPTTASAVYSGPITLTAGATINAFAISNGMENSYLGTAIYMIPQTAATPTISPSSYAGLANALSPVTISDSNDVGASIYYTLDGLTPTTSSTLYTGPITLNVSTTVKAISVVPGLLNSNVAQAIFQMPDGFYNGSINATVGSSCSVNGPPGIPFINLGGAHNSLLVSNLQLDGNGNVLPTSPSQNPPFQAGAFAAAFTPGQFQPSPASSFLVIPVNYIEPGTGPSITFSGTSSFSTDLSSFTFVSSSNNMSVWVGQCGSEQITITVSKQ